MKTSFKMLFCVMIIQILTSVNIFSQHALLRIDSSFSEKLLDKTGIQITFSFDTTEGKLLDGNELIEYYFDKKDLGENKRAFIKKMVKFLNYKPKNITTYNLPSTVSIKQESAVGRLLTFDNYRFVHQGRDYSVDASLIRDLNAALYRTLENHPLQLGFEQNYLEASFLNKLNTIFWICVFGVTLLSIFSVTLKIKKRNLQTISIYA